ncbi:MAG TPA: hypothetical protein VFO55_10445 [Gemmatimonadaceae bacterium]|nr:hypothetical protein [Gemmatimonadaceae bacterium]
MRAPLLWLAFCLTGCGGDFVPADTTQRSMDVPVPSTGTAGRPRAAKEDRSASRGRAKGDPETIAVRSRPDLGTYLVDGSGRSLYAYSGDEAGQTACLTDCATVWPPVIVETLPRRIDTAIDAASLTTTTRPDGTRQLVLAGMPLYYSNSDREPGDTWGHFAMSFGGRFTLVSPAGKPLAPRR